MRQHRIIKPEDIFHTFPKRLESRFINTQLNLASEYQATRVSRRFLHHTLLLHFLRQRSTPVRYGAKTCIPSTNGSGCVPGADLSVDPSSQQPGTDDFPDFLQLPDLTDIVFLSSSAIPLRRDKWTLSISDSSRKWYGPSPEAYYHGLG
jgi:hypothetical protein